MSISLIVYIMQYLSVVIIGLLHKHKTNILASSASVEFCGTKNYEDLIGELYLIFEIRYSS
jgi:hypothetical protein